MEDGQLSFFGEVKRPSKFRADPTVDHIMSNIANDPTEDSPQQQKSEEASGMVTLRVLSNPADPQSMRPVEINLNGEHYTLPRDVPATVPKEIYEVIKNSESSQTVLPTAMGEKITCQFDHETGQYIKGKEPKVVENRRFNVIVEDMEG